MPPDRPPALRVSAGSRDSQLTAIWWQAKFRRPLTAWSWRKTIASTTVGLWLIYLALQPEVSTIRPDGQRAPLTLANVRPAPGDWPWYRGASQQGQLSSSLEWLTAARLPVTTHWQRPVSTQIVSAPCSWGTQIFQLEYDARVGLRLVSLQTGTGQRQWVLPLQDEPRPEGAAAVAVKQSGATQSAVTQSAGARSLRLVLTPACDGLHVFVPTVSDGQLLLTAVTLEGRRAWTQAVGPYVSRAGYGISPAIAGSLVVLNVDQPPSAVKFWQRHSYIVGVHRQTGDIVWRTRRPDSDSQGIPVVAQLAGRPQLIVPGRGQVVSYNPANGERLWFCRWLAQRAVGSVVCDEQQVYVTASDPQGELLCIRGDGNGDVTATHLQWRSLLPDGVTGALVLADPLLIHQKTDGRIVAYDKITGRSIWRTKVAGQLEMPPLLSQRQLVCFDTTGVLRVLDIDRRGELAFEMLLDGAAGESLVISRDQLLVTAGNQLAQFGPPLSTQTVVEPRGNSAIR